MLLPIVEVQLEVRDARFNDEAKLDAGAMCPTALTLKELSATEENKIGALVKKAVK